MWSGDFNSPDFEQGRPVSLEQLHNNSQRVLEGYFKNKTLDSLIGDIYDEQNPVTFLAIAEFNTTGGDIAKIPLILTRIYRPPRIKTIGGADFSNEENYIYQVRFIDYPETIYTILNFGNAINRDDQNGKGIEPFSSPIAECLNNMRAPNDINEYIKYYEDQQNMLAYHDVLNIYNNGQPALIEYKGNYYQIISTSSDREAKFPNLQLVRLPMTKQKLDALQPKTPDIINITYGGSITAFYDKQTVDLEPEIGQSCKHEWPDETQIMNSNTSLLVSNIGSLRSFIKESLHLSPEQGSVFLRQIHETRDTKLAKMIAGLKGKLS